MPRSRRTACWRASVRRWYPIGGPVPASPPKQRRTPDESSLRVARRLYLHPEGAAMTDRQIMTPGLVPTGPTMLTSRFNVADGYTYDGYVRTGGYFFLDTATTEMSAAE